MPVTVDSFLWEATGFHPTGTSPVVTHPDAGGTTAGTTVLIMFAGTAVTAAPAGFASVGGAGTATAWVKSDVAAAETSWTFTLIGSGTAAWYLAELDNVSLVDPADGLAATSAATVANGATKSTNNSSQNAGSSGVALAMLAANKVGINDVQSWSGWTNSFAERVDAAPAPGTAGRQMAVAYKLYEGWSTYETTATFATSVASASVAAQMVLLRSADASINAPLAYFTGFGFGTHGGLPTALGGGLSAGTFGTNYSVLPGQLKVVASASVANVVLPALSSVSAFSFGARVKVESGSGTPEVLIFDITGGSADNCVLLYDVTNTKLGVQWAGGTAVWQSGTTALNATPWIDVRVRANSSIWHLDWSIDGVAQTSPTDLTGRTVGTPPGVQVYLGSGTSQTVTVYCSGVVISRYAGAYPLGPHAFLLLVPETTGATVSGTSTNFQRFTGNGTLANVDGTEGALLDEVPPTVSASSDGVVQVAVAASDYLNLPMGTYTLASDEIIAGVRFVASEWGGTGSGTGTLGWRGYDGTTETTFQAASASYDADSLTAISATYPRWVSAMWSGGLNGAWTQTRLDAAAIRMGFSTDATPDMGASAVYLEVATRDAPTVRTLTIEDPISATVDIVVNPYHSATVSYVITNNDPAVTVAFSYSLSGTPQTPVNVGPSSSTTVDIHADAFADVSDIGLTAS